MINIAETFPRCGSCCDAVVAGARSCRWSRGCALVPLVARGARSCRWSRGRALMPLARGRALMPLARGRALMPLVVRGSSIKSS
jgi:hypothetical protein